MSPQVALKDSYKMAASAISLLKRHRLGQKLEMRARDLAQS